MPYFRRAGVWVSTAPTDPYEAFAFGYWAWMNYRLQQLALGAHEAWWPVYVAAGEKALGIRSHTEEV